MATMATTNNLKYYLDKKLRRLILYARIATLAMLHYYGGNGMLYQDIKFALRIEDGALIPNLNWLKEHGYIEAKEEKVEGKSATVYYITDAGERAFNEIKTWLNTLLDSEKVI